MILRYAVYRCRDEVGDERWTDERWIYNASAESGTICRRGWWLDDEHLEATSAIGDTNGFRLFFNRMIRRTESFSRGTLTTGCAPR